eukprot:1161659-Pelagomonas_calceolata.AAC.15
MALGTRPQQPAHCRGLDCHVPPSRAAHPPSLSCSSTETQALGGSPLLARRPLPGLFAAAGAGAASVCAPAGLMRRRRG